MSTSVTPLPDVTVYSKRNCAGCHATYRALRQLGIPFTGIDVEVIDGAADRVRELGYTSLPVVVVESIGEAQVETWSGFRPDRLRKLVPKVGDAA